MPSAKELIDELHFLSDRLSTQVRTVALGLLALSWGLLLGESRTAVEAAEAMKRGLLIIGVMAILTMFLDFLQYVCGYLDTNRVRERAAKSPEKQALFNSSTLTYRSRNFLFWAKQILLSATVVYFVFLVSRYFARSA